MNEDGTGNRDKLKSMVDSLETKEWRQEGTMVLEKCSNRKYIYIKRRVVVK